MQLDEFCSRQTDENYARIFQIDKARQFLWLIFKGPNSGQSKQGSYMYIPWISCDWKQGY